LPAFDFVTGVNAAAIRICSVGRLFNDEPIVIWASSGVTFRTAPVRFLRLVVRVSFGTGDIACWHGRNPMCGLVRWVALRMENFARDRTNALTS
jgi:hypothetical protein